MGSPESAGRHFDERRRADVSGSGDRSGATHEQRRGDERMVTRKDLKVGLGPGDHFEGVDVHLRPETRRCRPISISATPPSPRPVR